MLWASARCKSQFGAALRGTAERGGARPGAVRHDEARVADGSTEGQPSLLLSMGAVGARQHSVRQCVAGHAAARRGKARAIDDGTEALRFPAILTRMVAASFGVVGKG